MLSVTVLRRFAGVPRHANGVDAVGWQRNVAIEVKVGRGKAEPATTLVALDHSADHRIATSQQAPDFRQPTFRQQPA